MFTQSFILWTGLYCTLPVLLVLVFLVGFPWIARTLFPGLRIRLRPGSAFLIGTVLVLGSWGLILQGVYSRRCEYLFARELRAEEVQSIVYFRNYKVTRTEQISEFVEALNNMKQLESRTRPFGVTFEIKLKDGRSRVWTAGFDKGTQQVWVQTETPGYYLSSPELTAACKKAHFPL